MNKIFNIGKNEFVRKIATTGFTLAKIVTANLIKDYTISSITPFLTAKLGISSKILLVVIIAFL